MINVYPGPEGAAGHVLPHPSPVFTTGTPIIWEDGELHLQFANLYDSRLSSAFYVLFNTSSRLRTTK